METKLALCLLSVTGSLLLAGCQCPRPVGEYTAVDSSKSVLAPEMVTVTRQTGYSANQSYPNGNSVTSGGPLYYEGQNANWEQAPPFGEW